MMTKCSTCGAETFIGAYGFDGEVKRQDEIERGEAYVIQPEDAFYSDAYAFGDGAVAVLLENIARTKREVWLTRKRDYMWWEEPEWLDFCPTHGETYDLATAAAVVDPHGSMDESQR